MKYIVSVSGGLGSAEALKRTIETYGKENVVAVFADVKGDAKSHFWAKFPIIDQLLHERFGGESRDTYRFLWQLSYHFDIPIERLEDKDGRTIFSVLAANRAWRLWVNGYFVHKCSEILKREQIKEYIQTHFKPGEYTIVLGMEWDEDHRVKGALKYWRKELGWDVEVIAPNAEFPLADNCTTERWITEAGIEIPAAYPEGFEHGNCNQGCIAAGQGYYANLYFKRPGVYFYWMWIENGLIEFWGKFVTILKDERGGVTKPLSLQSFVARILTGDYIKSDIGGCGCFVGNVMAKMMVDAPIVPPVKKELVKPVVRAVGESLPLFKDIA